MAFLREAITVAENPVTSKVWNYPEIAEALVKVQAIHSAIVPRCAYDDAPHGRRIGKKYRFVSKQSWITQIHRPCPFSKLHVKCSRDFPQQDTGNAKANTGGKVLRSGIKDKLVESQSYPKRLGFGIVDTWLHPDRVAEDPPVIPGQADARHHHAMQLTTWSQKHPSRGLSRACGNQKEETRKANFKEVTKKRCASGAQGDAPSWLQPDVTRGDAAPRAPVAKASITSASNTVKVTQRRASGARGDAPSWLQPGVTRGDAATRAPVAQASTTSASNVAKVKKKRRASGAQGDAPSQWTSPAPL